MKDTAIASTLEHLHWQYEIPEELSATQVRPGSHSFGTKLLQTWPTERQCVLCSRSTLHSSITADEDDIFLRMIYSTTSIDLCRRWIFSDEPQVRAVAVFIVSRERKYRRLYSIYCAIARVQTKLTNKSTIKVSCTESVHQSGNAETNCSCSNRTI